MKKIFIGALGALVVTLAPFSSISCSVAKLRNPNRSLPTIDQLRKESPGFGDIAALINLNATDEEIGFDIAAAFFSDYKWIKFYLGNTPEKIEENFQKALREIEYRVNLISASEKWVKIAKEVWGKQIWRDNDDDATKVNITKDLFISLLIDQLGSYDSGYDWFIKPLILKIKDNL